jgi:hypothetical protein
LKLSVVIGKFFHGSKLTNTSGLFQMDQMDHHCYSPILLDKKDRGQGCPSAADMCTAEVLDMLKQCLSLQNKISQIIKQYLYIQCTNNGCSAINRLQKLISIKGRDVSDLPPKVSNLACSQFPKKLLTKTK